MAKSSDVRVYGIDAVLSPVIADLKILATDVCVQYTFIHKINR